uniref:Uncharacterized protein n=1 Tax=Amphimedon queenslandica TaxID=400682 RepID=A0A1X7UUY4_AMPQE
CSQAIGKKLINKKNKNKNKKINYGDIGKNWKKL